ncbi:hypothetical protein U91I_00233 [alpha proteobacterium U9-1i]|nr:hypothetical protein U91I_00233 [alpha proteobacterium U9-1i]
MPTKRGRATTSQAGQVWHVVLPTLGPTDPALEGGTFTWRRATTRATVTHNRRPLTRRDAARRVKTSYWDRPPMRGARERLGRGASRLLWFAPRVFLRGLADLILGLLQLAWAAIRQTWEDLVTATPAIIRSPLDDAGKALQKGGVVSARAMRSIWIAAGNVARVTLPIALRVLGATAATLLILALAFTPELTTSALAILALAAALFALSRAKNAIAQWGLYGHDVPEERRKQLAWATLMAVGAAEMGFVLFPLLSSSDPFVADVTWKALIVYAMFALGFIALAWTWKRTKPMLGASAVLLISLFAAALRRILQAYARVGGALLRRLRRIGRRRPRQNDSIGVAGDAPVREAGAVRQTGSAQLEFKNEWSVFKFSFIDMSLVSGSLVGLSWLSIVGLAATGFEVKASIAGQTNDGGMTTLQISAGWSPESRQRMQRFWQDVTEFPGVIEANAASAWADFEQIARDIGESLDAVSTQATPELPTMAPLDPVTRELDPQARGALAPLTWRVGSASLLASTTGSIGIDTLAVDGLCTFSLVIVLGQASSDGEAGRNAALSEERARSAATVLSRQAMACPGDARPEIRAIALGQNLVVTADASQRRLILVGVNHAGEPSAHDLRNILRGHSNDLAILLADHAVFCEPRNQAESDCVQ